MRIYIDMDGVISDFENAVKTTKPPGYESDPPFPRPDKWVDYRNLDIIPGAVEAVHKLNQDFDVFIATTPPWDRPEVWGHKREWIADYFPYLKQKMVLTHRKDLLIGDILIDDSRWRGQPAFKGEWYWFNQNWSNRNWKACLEWIYKKVVNEKV